MLSTIQITPMQLSRSIAAEGSASRHLQKYKNNQHSNPVEVTTKYDAFLGLLEHVYQWFFSKPSSYENKKALQENVEIDLALAMSAPVLEDSPDESCLFPLINDRNEIENYFIQNARDADDNIIGINYMQKLGNGDQKLCLFVPGITLEDVRNFSQDPARLSSMVQGLLERFKSDFNYTFSEHRIEGIRYALNFVIKHPDRFTPELQNEASELSNFLNNNPSLTSQQFKLEVAKRHLEKNAGDKSTTTKDAALYLVNNTTNQDDPTYSRVAVRYMLKNNNDFNHGQQIEAIRVFLKSATKTKTATDAVKIIVSDPTSETELIQCAIRFIDFHPGRFDGLVREKAIINVGMPCSEKEYDEAVLTVISKSENCKRLTRPEAAKRIISSESGKYPIESMRSAAYYIVHSRNHYANDKAVLRLATNYISQNPGFLKSTQLRAAQAVVLLQNKSFFQTPISGQEGHKAFASAFNTAEEKAHLEKYSNALFEILNRNENKIEDIVPGQGNRKFKRKLTIFSFWIEGSFDKALANNFELTRFILDNQNDESIRIWNASAIAKNISDKETNAPHITHPNTPPVLSGHVTMHSPDR